MNNIDSNDFDQHKKCFWGLKVLRSLVIGTGERVRQIYNTYSYKYL